MVPLLAILTATAAPSLSIVYDGVTEGLGDKSCTLSELAMITRAKPPGGLEVSVSETGLGVLLRKGRIVFDPTRLGDPLAAADVLSSSDEMQVIAEHVPVLVSDNAVSVQWPREGFPDVIELMARRHDGEQWLHTGYWQGPLDRRFARLLRLKSRDREVLVLDLEKGATNDAVGPSEEISKDPEGYEFTAVISLHARFGSKESEIYSFCRMEGEAGRRLRVMRAEIASVPPDRRLVLSAGGNFAREGLFSDAALVKPTLEMRSSLGYDAYAPAEGELERGIAWLKDTAKQHQLPLIAANLRWKEGPDKGKTVFPPYRIVHKEGLAIVVVGVVSPDLATRIAWHKLREVEIEDTEIGIDQATLQATIELGRRPDLVVLLGRLREKAAAQSFSAGSIDLVLGVFETWRPSLGVREHAEVATEGRPPMRRALMVARGVPLSFGRIDVSFGEDAQGLYPRSMDHRTWAIDPNLDPDPEVTKVVTRSLLNAARQGGDIVLPAPQDVVKGDAELEEMSKETDAVLESSWTKLMWQRLAAHAARDVLHAEAAFVRDFGLSVNSSGQMSAFVVGGGISARDSAVIVYLTGSEILELVARAVGDKKLIGAGIDPSGRTIDRRPLVPSQRYRVVVPDAILTDTSFEGIFAGKPIEERESFSALLVQHLRSLRDASGGLGAKYASRVRARLRPEGEGMTPLWTIGLEQIGIAYLLNDARNTGTFGMVREQRLQLPDFNYIQLRGAISATYDREELTWRSAASLRFDRIFFGDMLDDIVPENQREREDAVLGETELRLKILSLAAGKEQYSLVPYLRAAYETELTPIQLGTRAERNVEFLRRKSYLNGTAGVGLFPGGILQELKLGVIVQNDFAKEGGRPLQIGMTAQAKLARPIAGPVQAGFDGHVTWFPARGEQSMIDDDVVGLETQAALTVSMPIIGWLNLGLVLDWLGFRGKVPETDEFGHSLQIGARLFIDRTWKPAFEPLF
jgi:hypothetical protein